MSPTLFPQTATCAAFNLPVKLYNTDPLDVRHHINHSQRAVVAAVNCLHSLLRLTENISHGTTELLQAAFE
ncbi:MAG: hypothetical protein LQ351_001550 [Letrouitia transgressa]|nr:MAG: hypothetical protein LQ351_001550 [Letrouitia transgressa]